MVTAAPIAWASTARVGGVSVRHERGVALIWSPSGSSLSTRFWNVWTVAPDLSDRAVLADAVSLLAGHAVTVLWCEPGPFGRLEAAVSDPDAGQVAVAWNQHAPGSKWSCSCGHFGDGPCRHIAAVWMVTDRPITDSHFRQTRRPERPW